MEKWHPPLAARIALRVTGLALIATLAPAGRWLRGLVNRSPAVTPLQLLLAALCFLCATVGMGLVLLGPDLWKPVRLSDRWTDRAPPRRPGS